VRKIAALIAISLTLFLSGCVPVDCLNPLYSDNTIIDKSLVGDWVTGDPSDYARIRIDLTDDVYQIVCRNTKEQGYEETVYRGHLISLGGEKYLDMEPKMLEGGSSQPIFNMDSSKKGAQFSPTLEKIAEGMYLELLGPVPVKGTVVELRAKLRPVHWIIKVEVTGKTIALSQFDREWVEEAIEKNLIQAKHSKSGREKHTHWVLSGSTPELQQFVMHHGKDPGAFTEFMTFWRPGEAPPAKPEENKDDQP
jgi:hypothetical protein